MPPAFVKGEDALINVVIETPKGSRNKFAFDEDSWLFELTKILPSGTAFPLDFGFVPRTKAADGDPLDVLVITEQSAYPGCTMKCRPIGIIEGEQTDSDTPAPERNDRVIAVPEASMEYARLKTVDDLSKEHLKDLVHFFIYYNELAGGSYKLIGTKGPEAALKAIKKAQQ